MSAPQHPPVEPETMSDRPAPPRAEPRPYAYEAHGIRIEDPWHWLRDRAWPKVADPAILAHLEAENAWFEAAMAPHAELVETLFQELKGRIKDDDRSVPVKDGDWWHWWAYQPGAAYRRWYRRRAAGGLDELVLDEVAEAAGKDYFRLGGMAISPDGRLLAMMVDDSGAERFSLRIRDLATGADLETVSTVAMGGPVWTSESDAVVYTETNEHWRSYRARLHRIGTPPKADVTLYEETEDAGFQVGVGRSTDRSLIFLDTRDMVTSEVRFVPAGDAAAPPTLVARRRPGVRYGLDAAHGRLWIVTDDEHVNRRLAVADPAAPDAWETVIAGSDEVYLREATAFRHHLVIEERLHGLDQVRLRSYDGEEHRVAFPEASYDAGLGANPEFAPDAYRLGYSSMVTPGTVYDYHPAARRLEVLKVQEVPSGYDASAYATERLAVTARDGAEVPVSIVYRRDFPRDGSGKLHLYGYGAYGIAIPPSFSTARLSLLDRGFACAIAHIRGGDDLGHRWYLDGKLDKRWNTFHDFVDVVRGLCAAGFAAPGRIAIEGGSAGGELMGVVANTDPELWGAVVAHVPFVDVLATMLDASLPLTPGEWPEWGNPIEDGAAFELIRSYSPYDNVAAQAYPAMLVTAGLTDPRVSYWEPAKWVAKLRATGSGDRPLLLKMNMGAGHGGRSGRWESLRETAEAQAFVLMQMA
jgi:oligopeptidase B